jgi:hypothetical protein
MEIDPKKLEVLNQIRLSKRDEVKYPINTGLERVFLEVWELENEEWEQFHSGAAYLVLWAKNFKFKYKNLYNFIEEEIIFHPPFADKNGLLVFKILYTNKEHMFESYEEELQFNLWAFGRATFTYDIEALELYNEKHAHLHELKPDDVVLESLKKMYEIWKRSSNEHSGND